ncbi:hypothetical protein L1987_03062 [Smallanthus sonchifolius]|uniref:Uncharacterized protein n=1 Tax=Smallanthus sonchifolius TaxID=185202 RepID=A0ACB9K9T5_9ASTR|nr:hypothetical protein L1987_03062 [Smallanthus sonchifolius]
MNDINEIPKFYNLTGKVGQSATGDVNDNGVDLLISVTTACCGNHGSEEEEKRIVDATHNQVKSSTYDFGRQWISSGRGSRKDKGSSKAKLKEKVAK